MVGSKITNGTRLAELPEETEAKRAAAASNTHVLHTLICDKCIQDALRNPHNHHILVGFQQHNWLSRVISGTPQRFQSGYVFLCHLFVRV